MSRPPTRITALLAVIATSAAVLVTVPLVQAANSAVEGAVYAGQTVSAPAGCSTDPASGPAPSIDWGDQTSASAGTCTQNPSGVSTGSHTYAEEGDYSAVAHYTSPNGARTTPFSVHVADAALTATSNGVSATAGAPFSAVVAHFTDADPGGTSSDHTVTVAWGDGSSSAATVQPSGAGWDVTASHTYANAGAYPTSVAITDAGGASTSASGTATITSSPPTTTSTTTSSTPATSTSTTPPPPAQASFTLPPSAGAGRTVMIDAGASRHSGVTITTYRWTVNGKPLATCAGATSELMTRTLPAGSDTIALTLLAPSGGSLATMSHTIAVHATAQPALVASGRGRAIALPAVATCLLGPQDPPGGAVAPGVRFAPRAGCDTQVQSGVIDAVGCLTEHQDPIVVTFVPGAKTSDGRRRENQVSPAGQRSLDGVNVTADQNQLIADVENAINPAEPPLCRDPRTGATFICSTVGGESLSPGARFGGGPVENIGPVTGFSAAVARIGTPTAAAAGLHGPIQLLHPACPAPPATVGARADHESCLDLWVADGPVRINGIDSRRPPAANS